MGIFILISFIVAYFLSGDFFAPYYKDYSFIFLKILQSFYRGSIDSVDEDSSFDRDNINEPFNGPHSFGYYIKNAQGPFYSLPNKIGYAGYLIVNNLFFKLL